jgi:hypothetical protein
MKFFYMETAAIRLTLLLALFIPTWLVSQTTPPVVVMARMEKGALVYRVLSKKKNSLSCAIGPPRLPPK